jgi:hypothetical protein
VEPGSTTATTSSIRNRPITRTRTPRSRGCVPCIAGSPPPRPKPSRPQADDRSREASGRRNLQGALQRIRNESGRRAGASRGSGWALSAAGCCPRRARRRAERGSGRAPPRRRSPGDAHPSGRMVARQVRRPEMAGPRRRVRRGPAAARPAHQVVSEVSDLGPRPVRRRASRAPRLGTIRCSEAGLRGHGRGIDDLDEDDDESRKADPHRDGTKERGSDGHLGASDAGGAEIVAIARRIFPSQSSRLVAGPSRR